MAQTVGAALGLVTGFLVLFGATYVNAFYGYFGITQGVLQYSIQDQLLQSAQPMFGTAALLLALAVLVWILDRLSAPLRRRPGRVGRRTRLATAVVGTVLAVVGLLAALGTPPVTDAVPPRPGALALLVGAIFLLGAGEPPRATGRGGERFLVVGALVLAVFWVATVYAGEAGSDLARQVDESPDSLGLVTVFSSEYLDLPGPTVIITQNVSPDGVPLYRYTGLRLLTYSDGRWFFLTGSHAGYRPTATVLSDSPELRIEVVRARETAPD